MSITFIYALCDPDSGVIRYIGKSNNPQKRFINHRCYPVSNHRGNWIRKLASEGKEPKVIVLREVPVEEWEEWEQRYIRSALALGFPLVNSTPGGDGVHKHSAESLAKMIAASKACLVKKKTKS